MARLIDSQISQNSGSFGAPNTVLDGTPQLFGTLGLITAGAGPNLRVILNATVTIGSVLTVLTPAVVQIFRGVGPGATLIYTAVTTLPLLGVAALTTIPITVTAADFNPPNPGFLTYQAFVFVGGVAVVTRIGPESFNATAYSD
ncbi:MULTISPECIES: hypothetical protein [unclassified Paenibacillus]|uniref:hypothetical protein n=1 Tax=unclassified Paenibacillus TaxID=185978 RepID=UPI001C11417E|nr:MULTISPECIES: hypothetical protein [unclassified Paenibacillus]MBU5440793.1 hypothetical protein [Paenibacillus sp. MSJ-34]CAH0118511.1 hypothetical protein PAE9249_01000 [Paenibacillus sp. CECT 9249]